MYADKMSIEELLSDESFINYCKGVSTEDIVFWENYKQENPDKALLVDQNFPKKREESNTFLLMTAFLEILISIMR